MEVPGQIVAVPDKEAVPLPVRLIVPVALTEPQPPVNGML